MSVLASHVPYMRKSLEWRQRCRCWPLAGTGVWACISCYSPCSQLSWRPWTHTHTHPLSLTQSSLSCWTHSYLGVPALKAAQGRHRMPALEAGVPGSKTRPRPPLCLVTFSSWHLPLASNSSSVEQDDNAYSAQLQGGLKEKLREGSGMWRPLCNCFKRLKSLRGPLAHALPFVSLEP